MSRQGSRPRKAFTLIELLVVISIIALLIAILLPALRAAVATARGVACLSNQRQLGIGMAVYQADSSQYYPPMCGPWMANVDQAGYSIPVSNISWDWALWQHLGDNITGALKCPTDEITEEMANAYERPDGSFVAATRSYAVNFNANGGWPPELEGLYYNDKTAGPRYNKVAWVNQDAVVSPSEVYVVTERHIRWNQAGRWTGSYVARTDIDLIGNSIWTMPQGPHSQNLNWLFADGHAEVMSRDDAIGTGTTIAARGIFTRAKGD